MAARENDLDLARRDPNYLALHANVDQTRMQLEDLADQILARLRGPGSIRRLVMDHKKLAATVLAGAILFAIFAVRKVQNFGPGRVYRTVRRTGRRIRGSRLLHA